MHYTVVIRHYTVVIRYIELTRIDTITIEWRRQLVLMKIYYYIVFTSIIEEENNLTFTYEVDVIKINNVDYTGRIGII